MDSRTAFFLFDGELDIFLPPARRQRTFAYPFRGSQSLKHLIEAAGVPHTEIGLVSDNGEPVGMETIAQDGDTVFVGALQFDPASNPQFALDCHLGRLAAYLRLIGFDTLYQNDYDDETLVALAETGRIVLTRDRRLLMRRQVQRGYWLRSTDPQAQMREVVLRYRLEDQVKPFSRCLRCNGLLMPVEKAAVLHQLQPLTRLYVSEFRRCADCGQVYWEGSHFCRLQALVESIHQ
jgi:hypothetical protein